jgi:hypothetical protein
MSYLDAPRLHFAGWFQADVSTINNDVRTFQNASFVPEYQQLNQNGSWNPEGTGVFRFLDCVVTGGLLDGLAITSASQDPVVGMLVENADRRAPGKLVDLDPQQQMVSEIWGMQVRLLDATRHQVLAGEYVPGPFCNLWRRQQTGVPRDQQLAANYQSVLDATDWTERLDSSLLRALRDASDDGRLSICFNVYGYGRDATIPRYTMGHVVGSIGPYRRGEPKHFAFGRQMIADTTASLMVPAGGLYNAQGRFSNGKRLLTLDLGNSFPIQDANSGLMDIGQVLVGVLRSNPPAALGTVDAAQVEIIGEVPYRDPSWFTQTAGVQSFDLRGLPDCAALLPEHPLVLLTPVPSATAYKVLLQETIDGLYLRADQFVFRMDPGATETLELYASRFGRPLANTGIALTPTQGLMGGSGGGASMSPPTRPNAAIPDIATPADAFTFANRASTGDKGYVAVALCTSKAGPGTPRGYIGGQLYGVAYRLDRQPPGYLSNPLNYVSVLAFGAKPAPEAPTWYDDIQPIFAQYGNLYPIMSRYVVDLNDYASVCTRVKALNLAFSLPIHDANHMPVTRDLGRGDRDTILKWLSTPDTDGLPRLGRPAMPPSLAELNANSEATAKISPTSAPVSKDAADVSQADLGLLPEQGAGKTAFLMQFERRRRDDASSGDAP